MRRVRAVGTTQGRLKEPSSAPASGEAISVLATGEGWRVEQILTGSLSGPIEDLLDHDEWVVVLAGGAELDVDGEVVTMAAGDWLHLRAGVPHRVRSTEPPTSWLALHVRDGSTGPLP
jgi:cupin 2 domain-containing protein